MGLTENFALSRRYYWISADFRELSLKLLSLSESQTSNSCTHPRHPQADCYADPEYAWDDYIQS